MLMIIVVFISSPSPAVGAYVAAPGCFHVLVRVPYLAAFAAEGVSVARLLYMARAFVDDHAIPLVKKFHKASLLTRP